VGIVDVIGIGHCAKEEVLTLEVTKDKSNGEGNGIFRASTFIPERERGVLAPWGYNHIYFYLPQDMDGIIASEVPMPVPTL